MDKVPTTLIVDIGRCLEDLHFAILRPELPTIDAEVVTERIVDALLHDDTAEQELSQFFDLKGGYSHVLNENLSFLYPDDMDLIEETEASLTEVASCAVRIGHHLRRTFKNHKLYEGGFLNYEYGGKINDQTMVLRRRRSRDVS